MTAAQAPKNKGGRPKGSKTRKKSPLREVEALFKQFVGEAVLKAVEIMQDEGTMGDPTASPPVLPRAAPKPETKLAAAKLIIENYQQLQLNITKHEKELNAEEKDDSPSENDSLPRAPVFSLQRPQ